MNTEQNNFSIAELQNFINVAEKLMPGFIDKVKNRIDYNAKLLQEERNLSEDAALIKNVKIPEITERMQSLDADICACKKMLNAKIDEYNCCKSTLASYEDQARTLEDKLTAIHTEWIELNPAKPVEVKSTKTKLNVRAAFNAFTEICGWMPADFYTKGNLDRLYKRFDNLIHKRCFTTFMFNYSWTAIEVCDKLCENGYSTIADNIKSFMDSIAEVN